MYILTNYSQISKDYWIIYFTTTDGLEFKVYAIDFIKYIIICLTNVSRKEKLEFIEIEVFFCF